MFLTAANSPVAALFNLPLPTSTQTLQSHWLTLDSIFHAYPLVISSLGIRRCHSGSGGTRWCALRRTHILVHPHVWIRSSRPRKGLRAYPTEDLEGFADFLR